MGVDHRGHRIGGVVEAVDEFEAQRDQQRQAEQREDAERQRFMDALDVVQQAVNAVTDARRQQAEKNDGGRSGWACDRAWARRARDRLRV